MVDNNTTARWSNKGNLVVEDNTKGRECSCRDGLVLASNQPLNQGSQVPHQQVEFAPRRNDSYGNSGRVRELVQCANAAKRDSSTYATEGRITNTNDRAETDYAMR